jgi:uncharacterized protein (DUF302 family)
VRATLREKLCVEGEPYLILEACNPPVAHQALGAELELGVLSPATSAVLVVLARIGMWHQAR